MAQQKDPLIVFVEKQVLFLAIFKKILGLSLLFLLGFATAILLGYASKWWQKNPSPAAETNFTAQSAILRGEGYTLQLGLFADRDAASRFMRDLESLNIATLIIEKEDAATQSAAFYVVSGNFLTLQQAESRARVLERHYNLLSIAVEQSLFSKQKI